MPVRWPPEVRLNVISLRAFRPRYIDANPRAAQSIDSCTKYHPSPSKSFKLRHSILVPFPNVYIRGASGRVIQSDCYMHARNSCRSSEAAHNTRRFIFQESSPVPSTLISEISAAWNFPDAFLGNILQTLRITLHTFFECACKFWWLIK